MDANNIKRFFLMLLLADICIALFGLPFVWHYFDSPLRILGLFPFIAITQLWLVALLILLYLLIFVNRKVWSLNTRATISFKLLYTILAAALITKTLSGISYTGNLAYDAFVYILTGIILLVVYERYLKENEA